MKKLLLATSILAGTAGLAAAEVTLSGDARMGVVHDGTNTNFTSRARVTFTLSGESDSGLSFGASFRADNAADDMDDIQYGANDMAGGAESGTAGSVFISGAFGKLSMGDVDSAAEAAVGQVSGVGLTGLGDMNEISYIGAGASSEALGSGNGTENDPVALYEYSAGGFSLYVSANDGDQVLGGTDNSFGIAAKYSMDAYTFAAGYEDSGNAATGDKFYLGATAAFGAATVKAVYADQSATVAANDGSEYGLSVDYTANALKVTVFANRDARPATAVTSYGLGMAYDLGGGASVVGGIADNDAPGSNAQADLGVSFSF